MHHVRSAMSFTPRARRLPARRHCVSCAAPVSSVVVPHEVQVANVEPEESEPQPDGHAIVANMVLVHVCSRCSEVSNC
jgi:hypothetical protein